MNFTEKKRCVIIGGADIADYDKIRSYLHPEDLYVFCDSGLSHMRPLGITPDLIVGDFDSYENPCLNVETIVLPCEKDDTDTVFAAKVAVERGYTDFLLIGVSGKRLDHTLGNLSVLLYLDELGLTGTIVDDYSEMRIISRTPCYIPDKFSYFSLLNISGIAKGIQIKNAKYPLENADITCQYQYGISNEVLPGQTAEVTVEKGQLLLVQVF